MVTLEKIEVTTAEQVRALFGALSEDQRKELGLREDYSVELRIKIGRKQAIGGVIMNADTKFEESAGNWATVAQREELVQELPVELVLHLVGAALINETAQQMVYSYFGAIPEIDV